MASPTHRVTPGVVAAVFLLAYINCICAGAVSAAGSADSQSAGQAGCGHHSKQRSDDSDGPTGCDPHEHHPNCQHCNTTDAVKPSIPAGIEPLMLNPLHAAIAPILLNASQVEAAQPRDCLTTDLPPPGVACTLLSLRCALLN
jgi:hypothetical protein